MALKIRHGALTGTPRDGAGAYFSLDSSREGAVGLALISYGVKRGRKGEDGKVVQLWPAAGQHRVQALRVQMEGGLGNQLARFALSTRDFTKGGGYLRLKIGSRTWRRDAKRGDISWDGISRSLVFHNNSGPFADTLLRGDFVEIEVGMNGWVDRYDIPAGSVYGELRKVGTFQPVSTCDISLFGGWVGHDVPCAAGVTGGDGEWVRKVQAWSKKKGKGKGGRKYYDDSATLQGQTGGPYTAWLYGHPGRAYVSVSYPPASLGMSCRIVDIIVK